MKFISVAVALPVLASAAAITIDSTANVESIETFAGPNPQSYIIHKDATRKMFKGGGSDARQLRLKRDGWHGRHNGRRKAQTFMASLTGASFCGDCTVLAGSIVLKYMDGSVANVTSGVYVHHILTTGTKKNTSFVKACGGGMVGGSGFVGNGDDNANEPVLYASKDGSLETGYWFSPSDKFFGTYVLVNYNKEPKKVEVWYDLEYLPGHVGKHVRSTLISASCTGISTTPSTGTNGAALTTSSPMTFTESGYIVLARAHLHDGGVAMHLKVNRKSGEAYSCTSKAVYGDKVAGAEHDTITDVKNCNPHPIKVAAGDTMTMISEYNLKEHPLRDTGGHGNGKGPSYGHVPNCFRW
ncbi:hypothetical protein EJ08DRAFT_738818 [Tothia fuscella]|uniref:Uncharacterized protein n=1 Tax=Tothia fuscella TaxID=1048955 RepID=A0A9P4NFV2_9PEZI|nr:hypothetical protein EJ08DRAFT_738818 [Tothia fuscella]